MSATIHYLRPFQREKLDETVAEPEATPDPAEASEAAAEEETHAPDKKRTRRHSMPCGRNSRFKRRMDGSVVPRKPR
jgi:hypothetical protein